MIVIEAATEKGFMYAGESYPTIHEAMTKAEETAERYGTMIEWAQDPASGAYVGFESRSPKALTKVVHLANRGLRACDGVSWESERDRAIPEGHRARICASCVKTYYAESSINGSLA